MQAGNIGFTWQWWLCTLIAVCGLSAMSGTLARASDMTSREITVKLFETADGERVDFSDMNFALIDVSGLDFKKAILTGADLYGTDLSRSNLSGADLSYTRLDRASIIDTDLSGADLSEATLLRPTTFSNERFDRTEVARFDGAKLVRTRIFARLDGASFKGADLTEADFSPLESGANSISTIPHNQLSGVDFTGAVLVGANLQQGVLDFASFKDADLRGADLRAANLTGADFTGANLEGADLTGANLDGALLSGAKGLHSAKGLGVAIRPGDDGLKRP